MKAEALIAAGIPLVGEYPQSVLQAEAALEWIKENTTLVFDVGDLESVAALPACAKMFVGRFSEIMSRHAGVTSQSIEGLSMSFESGAAIDNSIWSSAYLLLRRYLKSQVRVIPAKRRW